MPTPIKLFFTGGGGAGTIEAVKVLKALGYEVVTADATPTSAGFSWADRSYVIPFGADDAFVPALREIVRRERPDFIIPLVDEEIPKVHRFVREEVPTLKIVGPTLEFSELTLDKWTMAQALTRHGLSVARSWLASDAAAATYPAIVKPCQGRGSRGLAFLDGPGDLRAYLAAAAQPADRYIVQERLHGREFTTSVVVGLDGTLFSIVPKEAADKRGITQVGITRSVPAIDELCRGITKALDPRGPYNVQLIVGDDGVPCVIEINPRYSTTMALTLASGVNEVDVVLRHARGEDPGQLTFTPDLMMLRYTAQIYVKESEWRPIDLRAKP
ncbi:MAG TPA: ATP-grasp domain-containing protein [Kofleriaceae bacterium]|nr:ATP-grasp domain-containing protein [Kofleriaceae bacterium]